MRLVQALEDALRRRRVLEVFVEVLPVDEAAATVAGFRGQHSRSWSLLLDLLLG